MFPRFSASVADAGTNKQSWSQKGPATLGVRFAPRCDVTASQLDAIKTGPTSPVFFVFEFTLGNDY